MRIISKFKDYYDSALAYGQDESVVFERAQHEVGIKYKSGKPYVSSAPKNADEGKLIDIYNFLASNIEIDNDHWYSYRNYFSSYTAELKNKKDHKYHILRVYVFFCGKLYMPVRVIKTAGLKSETSFYYDSESLLAFLDNENVPLDSKPKRYRWGNRNAKTKREELENWFESVDVDPEFLITNKVSIAYVVPSRSDETMLIINPCLSDIEFYKAMDAFSAYQELDMWISGTLAWPPNFMVTVPDKYRLENHGFDPKYGFRKRPGEGK